MHVAEPPPEPPFCPLLVADGDTVGPEVTPPPPAPPPVEVIPVGAGLNIEGLPSVPLPEAGLFGAPAPPPPIVTG
jgi:hypothetical protein